MANPPPATVTIREALEQWIADGYTPNETPLDAYGVEVLREVLASLGPEAAPDGVRYDADSGTWVARYTILTAGTTEAEAHVALASAVKLLAQAWPQRTPEAAPRCYAHQDGDCFHASCPQLRDGEPAKTGRHCPHDNGHRWVAESAPVSAEMPPIEVGDWVCFGDTGDVGEVVSVEGDQIGIEGGSFFRARLDPDIIEVRKANGVIWRREEATRP